MGGIKYQNFYRSPDIPTVHQKCIVSKKKYDIYE